MENDESQKISQYQLIKNYGIDNAQLHRLRKNMVFKTLIIDRLCQILDCRAEDIMEYVPPDDGSEKNIAVLGFL